MHGQISLAHDILSIMAVADVTKLQQAISNDSSICVYLCPSNKDNQQFENIPYACFGSPQLFALRHQSLVGKDQRRSAGNNRIYHGLSPQVNVHLLSAPSQNTGCYYIGRTAC